MTEYDVPWKEVFDDFLKEFLQLCLPEIHDAIDWNFPLKNEEQELPHLFPNSIAEGRVADKLFQARQKGSDRPTYFLIHAEVQVSRKSDFSKRLFTCFYRIWDRFQKPVVCIGVIADTSKSWRPGSWHQDFLGCTVQFNYPIVKLRDFEDRIEELQTSANPFATVILSHLRAQDSAKNPEDRFQFKIELVKSLYFKNWTADQVRKLFRFIDWIIDLPEWLEVQFKEKVWEIETENQMPYVTSIERLAKQEGKQEGKLEGRLEGRLEGKIQLLQELLGLPVSTDAELEKLSNEDQQQLLLDLRQRIEKQQ